jgi:hypothetical protein
MGDLFHRLRGTVESNARDEMEGYRRNVTEYRSAMTDRRVETAVIDFAVFSRRVIVTRATQDEPLTDEDLAVFESTGRHRGVLNLSMPAQRQVVGLHAKNVLREIQEAATPLDTEDVLQLVGWLGPQAARARIAYFSGYLLGVGRSSSVVTQAATLTRVLLTDESVAPDPLAGALGLQVAERYLVTVIRILRPPALTDEARSKIIEALIGNWRTPVDWVEPGEFVMLTPVGGDAGQVPDGAREQALGLIRDVAAAVKRPCANGAAVGHVGGLAESLALARRISQVAPAEPVPRELYTVDDMFVELSVAATPQVDRWMRAIMERLRAGPNLIPTLDMYYRHDMGRMATATALSIHPRTLDYRLRRIRMLTGVDPTSTRGVRIFSTLATRALAEG